GAPDRERVRRTARGRAAADAHRPGRCRLLRGSARPRADPPRVRHAAGAGAVGRGRTTGDVRVAALSPGVAGAAGVRSAMSPSLSHGADRQDIGERNRRLARVLVIVAAVLAVAALLAGIRW